MSASSKGAGAAGGLAGLVATIAGLREARVRRIGIRIEPQGVIAVYAIGHLRFPLEAVEGFSLGDRGSREGGRCVIIELRDGERRVGPSASIASRRPFRNSAGHRAGGQTTEVVAQLNDQLRRARRQATAALKGAPLTAL